MAPLTYSFNYHKKKRPYNKYKYYTHENRSKFKNPIPRSSARFLKFLKVFKIILLCSHLSHPLYILLHTEIKRQKFQFYYLDERVMRLFYGKCSLSVTRSHRRLAVTRRIPHVPRQPPRVSRTLVIVSRRLAFVSRSEKRC